jgi:type II secretory pathway pseudopilin PulG
MPRRDDGFILLEVLMSVTMIGILMTALTAFYASSAAILGRQGGMQSAAQVATSRFEEIRALDPASITSGSSSVSIGGLTYTSSWVPDVCWQAADPTSINTACQSSTSGTGAWAEFVRVRVTVTWRDRTCAPATCSLHTVTLISRAKSDPYFSAGP